MNLFQTEVNYLKNPLSLIIIKSNAQQFNKTAVSIL